MIDVGDGVTRKVGASCSAGVCRFKGIIIDFFLGGKSGREKGAGKSFTQLCGYLNGGLWKVVVMP